MTTQRRLVEQGAACAALALLAAAVVLLATGVARNLLASLLALAEIGRAHV